MNNIHIGPRLKRIADSIGSCHILCDIGCDHGKLGCYAVLSGIADVCISADISSDSLIKAYRTAVAYGLTDRINTVLSDGFSAVSEIPDVTVMSGMGGRSIIRVINNDTVKSRQTSFVLSPQSEVSELRRFLNASGFEITQESVICESGKYYPVIVCKYSGQTALIAGDDLLLGVKSVLVCDGNYRSYIEMLYEKCMTEIKEMKQGGADRLLVFGKECFLEMLKGRMIWLD